MNCNAIELMSVELGLRYKNSLSVNYCSVKILRGPKLSTVGSEDKKTAEVKTVKLLCFSVKENLFQSLRQL